MHPWSHSRIYVEEGEPAFSSTVVDSSISFSEDGVRYFPAATPARNVSVEVVDGVIGPGEREGYLGGEWVGDLERVSEMCPGKLGSTEVGFWCEGKSIRYENEFREISGGI